MQHRQVHPLLLALGLLALATAFVALPASAEVAAPATPAQVSVHYQDPHHFTESRDAAFVFGHGFDYNDYLQRLQAFLVERATPMLAPGEHLSITFTNIKLAGRYEPWRGPRWSDVRIMRDHYPPRFDFNFKLTAADGQVLREGARKLVDYSYLMNASGPAYANDSLRYDKAVLSRWLRQGPTKW